MPQIMSRIRGNGHIELKASELCLCCGLCCRGIIFNRAALKPDEIGLAKDCGLRYFTSGKGEFAFRLPCHLYQNDRCSIYLNRPHACKKYRCYLLKRLINGDIDLEASKLIVFQLKDLMDSIDKQMIGIEPSGDFRQRIVKFLDLRCRNPMIFKDPNALIRDIESFYVTLRRYIEKRAN
jgi:hypothetical protein